MCPICSPCGSGGDWRAVDDLSLVVHLEPQQSLLGSKLQHPMHHTSFSSCVTMAMEKLASIIFSPHLSLLLSVQEHRKKKSPVLFWCSKDLLGVNPNSSVNLLPLSNSLHNIAGIREPYDFLKTLHKYQQHNFI